MPASSERGASVRASLDGVRAPLRRRVEQLVQPPAKRSCRDEAASALDERPKCRRVGVIHESRVEQDERRARRRVQVAWQLARARDAMAGAPQELAVGRGAFRSRAVRGRRGPARPPAERLLDGAKADVQRDQDHDEADENAGRGHGRRTSRSTCGQPSRADATSARGGRPAPVHDLVEIAREPAEARRAERSRELAARQVLGLRNRVERREPRKPCAEPQTERRLELAALLRLVRELLQPCGIDVLTRCAAANPLDDDAAPLGPAAARRRTPPRARRARRGRRGACSRRRESGRQPTRSAARAAPAGRRPSRAAGGTDAAARPARTAARPGSPPPRLDRAPARSRLGVPSTASAARRCSSSVALRSGERRAEIDGPSVDAIDLAQLLQRRRVVGRSLGQGPHLGACRVARPRGRSNEEEERRERGGACSHSSAPPRGFQPGGGGQ